MHISKNAVGALVFSALIAVLALVLALAGLGMKFNFGAGTTLSCHQLWAAILAAAVVSFIFGWIRYDLAGALALLAAVVHDQLLTLALSSLLSNLFGLASAAPALITGSLAFTYCLTVPVIREARVISRSVSQREVSREDVARQAISAVRPLCRVTVAVSALFILAFALSGNLTLLGAALPLLAGLVAALLSSRLITPYLWAAVTPRRKGRK